jgi:hypothetical protein
MERRIMSGGRDYTLDVDLDKVREIVRLLDEAYDHYFENSDGHCKGSEGYVEIRLPNYFGRRDGVSNWTGRPAQVGIGIYSYVLGPHRQHDFESIDEALAEVRKWHEAEMTYDYKDDWGLE